MSLSTLKSVAKDLKTCVTRVNKNRLNIRKMIFLRLLFLLLVSTRLSVVNAQSEACFPKQILPVMIYPAENNYDGAIYSTIASETLQAVFSAGRSDQATGPTAFILRLNVSTNRVQWRRYYKSTGMDTVTAMAISPDGTNIAAHGSSYNIDV